MDRLGVRVGARRSARARLRAQLVAATDVYTWKLLRRDLHLSRRETARVIAGFLRGALAGGAPGERYPVVL